MVDDRDEPPPSEEELAASKRLREALEDPSVSDRDAELARSLRAAFDPDAIEPEEHARILDDVPSPEEIALAAELREALAGDPVVTALRAAWAPAALPDQEHRAIVARALPPPAQKSGRVIRVAFGVVTGTLAIAASVVVWMNASPAEVPLARARSTQPLFDEPFKIGDASARIDKIAASRASDFRGNRFAKWGVR